MNLTPPADVAAVLVSTMESTATVTRSSAPASFDRDTHAITDATPTTLYVGPCSYSGPKSARRSTAGADDRTVDYRIVSIPADAASLRAGDRVAVDGLPLLVIDEVLGGTHKARNRYRCVATTDAPGVPT